MDEYKRTSDELIARVDQKLSDFIERDGAWKIQHDRSANEWRISIESRLKVLEIFNSKIDGPIRAFAWILVIMMTSLFGAMGLKTFKYFEAHWK